MTPPTHFLLSWLVANIRMVSQRDTLLIVLAGLSPDIDGLGTSGHGRNN
ncbi:MAG: hypothetical protein HZA07_04410 [Nitrospirae bacterium]|nr:hypothetical protein [Nitrospirota bacterium]